jgi:hypothetical protein
MNRICACAAACILFSGMASAEYKVKQFKGELLNDSVIGDQSLTNAKILVTDFMGEINPNFTPEEQKRGLRGPYYIKFNLRDSKLRCLISKYDARNYTRLMKIKKNDRVSIIGRVDQLAMGVKKFGNPYYILRVSHIEPGWLLDKDQEIFSGFSETTAYTDVSPQDVAVRSEEYAGEYVRVKDRFSICSTFFTGFERDLNLDNERTLKFYLENCATPCYLPNSPANKGLLGALKSGDRVTVSGRLNLRPVADDALLLFSVSTVKAGW